MILPSVKDDKTKRWNEIVIKKNKVCISFEDIYAEFPFNIIFASAFTISQANLKVKLQINKNAFQWDAYRPLVDRIRNIHRGGGVSAQGGVYPGGVCPRGFCPGVCGRHPPVDRQTPVKT